MHDHESKHKSRTGDRLLVLLLLIFVVGAQKTRPKTDAFEKILGKIWTIVRVVGGERRDIDARLHEAPQRGE